MWRTIIALLCLTAILAGCETLYPYREQFDKSSRDYNRMVRWSELNQAAVSYADKTTRPEYEKHLVAAKGVKIADYRVKSVDYYEDKKTAEVLVEFDYYGPSGLTLRTVEDRQQWHYVEKSGWRLTSMPPAFQ
ncbi:hypothetical protein [Geobacter sp. AOG1]|uniref:hypothetical protein n=1 Tax=Geobacter sp. AOG1 TaxID=1566346 RepID=UPI001CC5E6FF|nr:hypothetical protein [Geobacter sp. AOG1]GFE56546.1 hypothetical protein AOG1_04250 [Geobacter sp. AOG1]